LNLKRRKNQNSILKMIPLEKIRNIS
jgi:hypothetical protein